MANLREFSITSTNVIAGHPNVWSFCNLIKAIINLFKVYVSLSRSPLILSITANHNEVVSGFSRNLKVGHLC